MIEKIYAFFHCDIWKSYASMRFIGVVDKEHYNITYTKIKKEMGYTEQDMKDYIYIKETELNDLDI